MGVYLPSTVGLPSEYQEVEYIESSGTQYIDTNLLVNGDFTTEAKYAKTTNVAWNTLFGTRNGTYCRYLVRCNSDSNYFTVQRSYSSANTNTIETYESGNYYNNNIYTVKLNKYLYIDSTLLKTYTTSTTTNLFPYKLYVFALNSAGTAADFGYYKLYYMKIWDNYNYLLRDFIPCYRKSDNVIGLYDLVDNQFYTNSGSGTFGKGNNIIMSELKNAYIGEVYEYSYDFRNKSSTQVTNDGWVLTRGTLALNANGLYGTSSNWNELYIQLTKMNTALANAKKMTMTLLGKHGNSGDTGNSFMSANGKYPNASKYTGLYYSYGSNNQYYYGGTNIFFTQTQATAGGTCEYVYVIDLVSKTVTLTFIQGSTNTYTHSISDSDITNIRTNNYIRCAALGTDDAISKINILIES